MSRAMSFREAMAGTWRRPGEDKELAIRFDLVAEMPRLLQLLGTVSGTLRGRVDVADLATGSPATGTIEVSPVEHRRIRYIIDFAGDDGARYHLDGWKSIRWTRALSTWTTLPATITDESGKVVGTATLRFPPQHTPGLVASMRLHGEGRDNSAPSGSAAALESRRWDGKPGRLEVWYETFTDPATGTGFWLHHEINAPAGGGPAQAGGWAAVFPPDESPLFGRFGPVPVEDGPHFAAAGVVAEPGLRRGEAGTISWDLSYEDGSAPLFTFPAATWRREILPGAQVVPSPSATFSGKVDAAGRTYELAAARGAAARIYGHGNAERWAWLHADLGGDDVLEIVAAVPRRRGLSALPPLPMVQLRLGGEDWPANPVLAAPRMRARLGLPEWTVEGRIGARRLRVRVSQPAARCVQVGYRDPDGATATCNNTERADAEVVVERRVDGSWQLEREWRLEGTAHAEVGSRP